MLISFGAVFVYAYGGLDLSLGSLLCMCAFVATHMSRADMPIPIIIITVVAIGLASGFIVGWLSRFAHLPVFIATLSMSHIFTGLCQHFTKVGQVTIPPKFIAIFNNWNIKIIILIVFLIITCFLFNYTRFGKYCCAIGGSPIVAELSGIPVTKYVIFAHMLVGLCTAIAALFSIARIGIYTVHAGAAIQIDVLIGLVLGGMPMHGGAKARFSSAVIGSMTITVIANGLTLIGMNPYFVDSVTALIFIVVVSLNIKSDKKADLC